MRDKDAGAAALLLAELALDQKRKGKTALDYVEAVYQQFGYFRNVGVSMFMTGVEGKQKMVTMLDSLRNNPPTTIGALAVTRVEDLRDEDGKFGPMKGATDAASRNVLLFQLGDLGRVALRPSGTEPKAKAYIEASSPPRPAGATDAQWAATRADVTARIQALEADFVKQAMGRAG